MAAKLYPCFVCEKRYAEIEEAEMCERKHAAKAPAAVVVTCLRCGEQPLSEREGAATRRLLADLRMGHAPLAAIATCPTCREEIPSKRIGGAL
jgi:hypothetical protein